MFVFYVVLCLVCYTSFMAGHLVEWLFELKVLPSKNIVSKKKINK